MGLLDKLFKPVPVQSINMNKNTLPKPSGGQPKYTLDPKKDLEQQMLDQNMFGYRDRKEFLKQQEGLLRIACNAQERYKNDGDIDRAILEYEKVMIEADPPLMNAQSHALFLADLYIKKGLNDKAWGYLNMLQHEKLCPVSHVRAQQARILKKEKKHLDAIETILLQHWNRFVEMDYNFYNHNACMRDIGPSVRALKWSFEDQEKCASFVEFAVSLKKQGDEMTITNLYRKFVEEKQKEEI